MIEKINIKGVACYKEMATLETDKNINLIYGLNGSGKSTLSEYLRTYNDPKYADCSIEPAINDSEEEILVYNEHYVDDVFYQNPKQPGIFSLSKENKDAKKAIDDASEQLRKLDTSLKKKQSEWPADQSAWEKERQTYVDRLWEVNRTYTGGDRVLDYCLEGFKKKKESLFEHVAKRTKPEGELTYSIESLKEQVQQLNAASDTPVPLLPEVVSLISNIESNPIFQQVITGNSDSYVAELINKLQNSDWVKEGLAYETEGVCPFCQRPYDDSHILEELNAYFDKAYEEAVQTLKAIRETYVTYVKSLQPNDAFETIDIIKSKRGEYGRAYSLYLQALAENMRLIEAKIKNPSNVIDIIPTGEYLQKLNDVIKSANVLIQNFNRKLTEKGKELESIKEMFWDFIRVQYDQTIVDFQNGERAYARKENAYKQFITQLEAQIKQQRAIIVEQQRKVINIEDSINHINAMLQDIGIDEIYIKRVEEEEMYAIARGEDKQVNFKTLSEGERTIISVLYFIETCTGLLNKEATRKKRIVVIDDPVSSLSTQYLFAIGRIISGTFYPDIKKDKLTEQYVLDPKVEQLFILTHSLYFLYEMTLIKKEHRDLCQKLFRVRKSANGSAIDIMHYEHIQSDYHSYWLAVKDKDRPILWANCMRNIIEYFFNFVEKRDLNNVMKALKDPKYQAFNRFINRESHSLGQNIYDFKDFDYDVFYEAFRLVFISNGYEEHFKKMSRIG